MKQIEIQVPSAETSEARRASTRDAIAGHFIGLHLGHQEYAVALTGNHLTNRLLRAAVTVVSRCIDQRHAERNACAQRLLLNSWRVPSLTQMRGALTERWDASAVWKLYSTGCRLRYCRSTTNFRCGLR